MCSRHSSKMSYLYKCSNTENNGFIGTIPSELKELRELRYDLLQLRCHCLGYNSTHFYLLFSRRLALQQGGLYGTIPAELSLLSNLLVLGENSKELMYTCAHCIQISHALT